MIKSNGLRLGKMWKKDVFIRNSFDKSLSGVRKT